MFNKRELQAELKQAGANPEEVQALSSVALRLSKVAALPVNGLPPKLLEAKQTYSARIWRRNLWTVARSLAVVAAIFVVGGLTVTLAQNSLPGDRLYGVKRLSEQVEVKLNPKFRDQLMMRRAEEVRALVVKHRDDSLVMSDLNDYLQAVRSDRTAAYPALEYCAGMLRTAEAGADATVRQAIEQSLGQLPDNS